MHDVLLLSFAIAAGATASGIVTALYKLMGTPPRSPISTLIHCGIMIFAGPMVLIENSTRAFKSQTCSVIDYGQALAVSVFWSLTTGLSLLLVCAAL